MKFSFCFLKKFFNIIKVLKIIMESLHKILCMVILIVISLSLNSASEYNKENNICSLFRNVVQYNPTSKVYNTIM